MNHRRLAAIDRMWRTTAHRVSFRPGLLTRELVSLRSREMARLIERYRPRAEALESGLARGDAGARAELARLADAALVEMRSSVRRQARRLGLRSALPAALDALWTRRDAREYMDDPGLDPVLRAEILNRLDHFNTALGSYESFVTLLRPLLQGPTRIIDLASGHGGFALAMSRMARAEGLAIEVTASDLRRDYLDLGEIVARREGLPVSFRVQDVRELSDLGTDRFDVMTCTQSLHHLPPGLIAVMCESALRLASRGIVFVDGCRSLRTGFGLSLFALLRYRHRAFLHDTWVSTRRFFVPEELELLARLGPWGDGVEASWVAPGFCLLRRVHSESDVG